ncbi:MAG: hypothetical protein WC124_02025 [Desulfoplanes sp.]
MTISFKVQMADVNAEIERLKREYDEKDEIIANRIMVEGKNYAHQLVRKDTGNLDNSIDTASEVTKLDDSIYEIKLANGMEYGAVQELDPKRGRPHIRPGAEVMKLRASGIAKEVYG